MEIVIGSSIAVQIKQTIKSKRKLDLKSVESQNFEMIKTNMINSEKSLSCYPKKQSS